MSVSGGSPELAGVDEVELRRQLLAIAHELMQRTELTRHQPHVWYLPSPDPNMQPRLYRRGEAVELRAGSTSMTIVTRLDAGERAGLIAWLVAQDPREAAPGTT